MRIRLIILVAAALALAATAPVVASAGKGSKPGKDGTCPAGTVKKTVKVNGKRVKRCVKPPVRPKDGHYRLDNGVDVWVDENGKKVMAMGIVPSADLICTPADALIGSQSVKWGFIKIKRNGKFKGSGDSPTGETSKIEGRFTDRARKVSVTLTAIDRDGGVGDGRSCTGSITVKGELSSGRPGRPDRPGKPGHPGKPGRPGGRK